jgi:hypothetical protein
MSILRQNMENLPTVLVVMDVDVELGLADAEEEDDDAVSTLITLLK